MPAYPGVRTASFLENFAHVLTDWTPCVFAAYREYSVAVIF